LWLRTRLGCWVGRRIDQRKQLLHFKLKDQRVKDELLIAPANKYDAVYNASDDEEKIQPELEQEWNHNREMYSSIREEIPVTSKEKERSG